MEWVETTGRSLDEAKDAALDQLGVDEQDAEFDVIEEPKLGLFGRVRTEARVRARIRPTSPRAKEDGRDRRRRRSRSPGSSDETAALTPPSAPPPPVEATLASPAPAVPPPPPRAARAQPQLPRTPAREDDSRERADMMDQDVPMVEQAEVGRQFLAGLLEAFGLSGSIEVREREPSDRDEEVTDLLVTGPDLGLLIGPGGGTLNAIQELTRTVVQRRTGGRNGRLLVDVSGYREKRTEALERFVRQVAEEVVRTGTATTLEPMHAADRKVVHDTVNTIDGVTTVSEGEEPRRRVVLEPGAG